MARAAVTVLGACALSGVAMGCAEPGRATQPPPAPLPATAWLDDEGRQVLHRGMNVSDAAKSAEDHLPGLSDAEVDLLVTHGITLVRYLVFWEAVEPTPGEYDENYLAAVGADVARFTGRGIDVLLDMHQDVYGEGFGFAGFPAWTCDPLLYASFEPPDGGWYMAYAEPEVVECFDRFWASAELQDDYARAWGEAAAALDQPGVAGWEVMNEPFGGTTDAETFEGVVLPSFYAAVAALLPSGRPVAVEPSVACNLTHDTQIELPDGDWLLAPHFYPPYAEMGTGYDGDFEEEAGWLDGLADEAEERRVPLLVGEFGIFSDAGAEADYVRSVLDAVSSRGGSAAYWTYDRGDSWQPLTSEGEAGPGLDGFLRPFLHRTPGPILSWTAAPLAFEVSGGTSHAPVEVVVPGDCTPTSEPAGDWDATTRTLAWPAPASGETLAASVQGCR